MKNHRTIIISVEQLTYIKEVLEMIDPLHYPPKVIEEIEIITDMIKATIKSNEDTIHGFCL